jgi:hypothetical protein
MPALGITQVKETGLELGGRLAQSNGERTGVVLHLGPRLIGHTITPSLRRKPNAQLAQPASQAGVFDLKAMFFLELLKDALNIPVALR